MAIYGTLLEFGESKKNGFFNINEDSYLPGYKELTLECDQFLALTQSVGLLESDFIVEGILETVKTKIVGLWNKFKEWVKKLVRTVKEKIKSIIDRITGKKKDKDSKSSDNKSGSSNDNDTNVNKNSTSTTNTSSSGSSGTAVGFVAKEYTFSGYPDGYKFSVGTTYFNKLVDILENIDNCDDSTNEKLSIVLNNASSKLDSTNQGYINERKEFQVVKNDVSITSKSEVPRLKDKIHEENRKFGSLSKGLLPFLGQLENRFIPKCQQVVNTLSNIKEGDELANGSNQANLNKLTQVFSKTIQTAKLISQDTFNISSKCEKSVIFNSNVVKSLAI